ncbi:MAG: cytochrome c [Melioribacteraceae bacterium]|jgi:cytochrome c2|nr:cytochrome c [Melioribacteraceae bacterium]
MTNAQKWVSAFLVLFILLLVLSKITNRQDNETETASTEDVQQDMAQSAEIDVQNLLGSNRCFTCHGEDLNGTGMGPSLVNVSENWKKASLVSYFQNPKAFLNNPRMLVLKNKYNREMPAQGSMTVEELDAVAEYLLTRK